MGRIKFQLNYQGVRQLLKSDEMSAICQGYAAQVANACGEGYDIEKRTYPERNGYAIFPATPKAMNSNLKHNTLLKAIS